MERAFTFSVSVVAIDLSQEEIHKWIVEALIQADDPEQGTILSSFIDDGVEEYE